MPHEFKRNSEGKLEAIPVDFEGAWVEEALRIIARPEPSPEALMEHFYGDVISDYMYDDPDATKDFFWVHHNLRSEHRALFEDKASMECIFDVYLLFKYLGYDVSSLNRDMYYEFGEHLEKEKYGKTKRMDLYIRNPTNNSVISFDIHTKGQWGIKGNASTFGSVGVTRSYRDFTDLLDQLQFFFNLLMNTDHNLQDSFKAFDDGEVLAKGWKEDSEKFDAAEIQREEEERNARFTQALCNAAAYLQGAKEAPFPEVK